MNVSIEILSIKDRFDSKSGVTQPFLCKASDEKEYVVKTKLSLTSKQIIAEYVAANLAEKLGLPIPNFKLIYISDFFVNSAPQDWKSGLNEGLAFATEYIEDATLVRFNQAQKSCNSQLQKEIYLFDYWINNSDRNLSRKDTGNVNLLFSPSQEKIFLIDHNLAFDFELSDSDFSHHIFSTNHRDWSFDLVDKPNLKDKFSEVLDNSLNDILETIPEEWLLDCDYESFFEEIKLTLNRISQEEFWEYIK